MKSIASRIHPMTKQGLPNWVNYYRGQEDKIFENLKAFWFVKVSKENHWIKPWWNGLASSRKLKTWVYLRLRLARPCVHLRWLAMTCVLFGWDQICTQVNASFLPFSHPTQVSSQVQLGATCDYLRVRLTRALQYCTGRSTRAEWIWREKLLEWKSKNLTTG